MKKRKLSAIVGNALIILGLLVSVPILIYEAVEYPWYLLFGTVDQADTVEPPKLMDSGEITYIPYSKDTVEKESDEASMPAISGILGGKVDKGEFILLGTLRIPKLSLSTNFLRGTGGELNYGVGHIPGTDLPDQGGNIGIGGHRLLIMNHPFRHLDKLDNKDLIYIDFDGKKYTYEVYEQFIVGPDESQVLKNVDDEANIITLVTCTPITTLENRLIVRGRLIAVEDVK